jgi:hypothetical protein
MFGCMMLCLQVPPANNTCSDDDCDITTAVAENVNAESDSDCAANDDFASVNSDDQSLAEYLSGSEDNSSVCDHVDDESFEFRRGNAMVDVEDNEIIAEREGFATWESLRLETGDINSEKLDEQFPPSPFDNELPIYTGSSIEKVSCSS